MSTPHLTKSQAARHGVASARTVSLSANPTKTSPEIPVTGAWLEGDPVGNRKFIPLGTFDLEGGARLADVTVAYETWGTLNAAKDNAILILHALTGDSHVIGEAGEGHKTAGWWPEMVGPGAPIDTNKWFVVAPNVLGGCQGTTGPASTAPDGQPWGSRFPYITVRDQVAVEIALSDALGIEKWSAVIGASMGGQRVLEWAASAPSRVARICVIASAAQTSGDQIAWAHTQLGAIRSDANFNNGDYYDAAPGHGPHVGLGLARQIAHVTYRSHFELDERFGRIPQGAEEPLEGGRFAVQSYLDHHAFKLARRFDANSYIALTESMITHDLGRDRGGVDTALRQIPAEALVIAVDSDRLFPPSQSQRIAEQIPNARLTTVTSQFGHDGFLIENAQVGEAVRDFLA